MNAVFSGASASAPTQSARRVDSGLGYGVTVPSRRTPSVSSVT